MSAKILIKVLALASDSVNLKEISVAIGFRTIYYLTIRYFKLCEEGVSKNKYMTGLFEKTLSQNSWVFLFRFYKVFFEFITAFKIESIL